MEICVLGTGVLGVTTAYELAKNGHGVTVVKRLPEPARKAAKMQTATANLFPARAG